VPVFFLAVCFVLAIADLEMFVEVFVDHSIIRDAFYNI
jgi:hypothetical protein